MLNTKRTAALAAEIVDKLEALGLDPLAKQEVIMIAGQLAIVEHGRAVRAAQQPQQPKIEDEVA
jgi:hypothetical protein